jgi:hypothetical protein
MAKDLNEKKQLLKVKKSLLGSLYKSVEKKKKDDVRY